MSPQNIQIGSSCLACTSAPTWKDASLPAGPPSSTEFSLGVPATSRAEVDQLLTQAEAAGGTVTAPAHMRPFGVYPGYFTDPDGRGDVVVPLTGLATAIRAAGHSVTIASNDEYEGLVVGCGLEFRALPGTHGMFDDLRWVERSGLAAGLSAGWEPGRGDGHHHRDGGHGRASQGDQARAWVAAARDPRSPFRAAGHPAMAGLPRLQPGSCAAPGGLA
jgi:hypothetical protein